MFAWYPSSPWPKKVRPSQLFRDAALQNPATQCALQTAPPVRLRAGLPHDIQTPAAAGLARSAFPLQAIEPRPRANRHKCYDSSSLLLFSPASPKLMTESRTRSIAATALLWAVRPALPANPPESSR